MDYASPQGLLGLCDFMEGRQKSLQDTPQAKSSLSNYLTGKESLVHLNVLWKIHTTTWDVCSTYQENSSINSGKCSKMGNFFKKHDSERTQRHSNTVHLQRKANLFRKLLQQITQSLLNKHRIKNKIRKNSSLLLHQFFRVFLGLLVLPVKCGKVVVH